ncbi:MAG: homoserine dehydrogenase, partial [Proteobacteria bacterium]|nr:homoserine dehydrogenase [Pseudomonadota bacterium]
MKEIKVGLLGFGTVGSGLAEVLLQQAERLRRKTGASIRLCRVADIRLEALPPQFQDVELVRDADLIFKDPEIDIVVELIGGIEPA